MRGFYSVFLYKDFFLLQQFKLPFLKTRKSYNVFDSCKTFFLGCAYILNTILNQHFPEQFCILAIIYACYACKIFALICERRSCKVGPNTAFPEKIRVGLFVHFI